MGRREKSPGEIIALLMLPGEFQAGGISLRTNAFIALTKLDEKRDYQTQTNVLTGWSNPSKGHGGYLLACLTHHSFKRWTQHTLAKSLMATPEVFCENCKQYLDPSGLELEF